MSVQSEDRRENAPSSKVLISPYAVSLSLDFWTLVHLCRQLYLDCKFGDILTSGYYRAAWNAEPLNPFSSVNIYDEFSSSDENSVYPSVYPSVCLSVKGVDCDKTKERFVQIFYTIRKIIAYSILRSMVGEGDPFYLKFLLNRPPLKRNRRFLTDIRS